MSVLVYIEHNEGKVKKSSLEAVSYAKEIAKQTGTTLVALAVGDISTDILGTLGNYGAQKVLYISNKNPKALTDSDYIAAICDAVNKENSTIVIFSNSFTGKSIAPAVAVKLKAAYGGGVIDIPEIGESSFQVKKMAFSGKAYAFVTLSSDIKVLAVNPNSFPIAETGNNLAEIEEFEPVLNPSAATIKVQEVIKSTEKVPLPEAEVVVSGGRGLKGPENWKVIEDLAEVLGAATACSKPVSDAGWRPHEEHVGQTGITISPNLYIAVGISGAIQHLAGVSSSKTIVAINKDPEAPIFKAADYGIVGDALEVVPKLTEAIRNFKEKG
ncbi:electron transfer flavoprotein subunit alpha/FixB family protein [Rubrolithibacter danxiaensis]|uniref:electron transfer flavoprotein subunit alpha/FixB family protein n=1 Tax=Rubrolithibacter danxiaensis TaxID=3390805 RepID=UPI003BF7F09C